MQGSICGRLFSRCFPNAEFLFLGIFAGFEGFLDEGGVLGFGQDEALVLADGLCLRGETALANELEVEVFRTINNPDESEAGLGILVAETGADGNGDDDGFRMVVKPCGDEAAHFRAGGALEKAARHEAEDRLRRFLGDAELIVPIDARGENRVGGSGDGAGEEQGEGGDSHLRGRVEFSGLRVVRTSGERMPDLTEYAGCPRVIFLSE